MFSDWLATLLAYKTHEALAVRVDYLGNILFLNSAFMSEDIVKVLSISINGRRLRKR